MRPVLIDTDPGIDDALALLLAWGSPELRVEAITTVAGNVGLDRATTNLIRLLMLRRPDPLPVVAPGAAAPLRRPLRTAEHYHGDDGLGDLDDWSPTLELPARPEAWELIATTARRHVGNLVVIALGPLTNLALTLDRAGDALRGARRLVVMGGAVDVPGNATPTSEFNIHVDPDAAARVLGAGLPVDLVPLDATRQARLDRARFEAGLAGCAPAFAARVAAMCARAFRSDQDRMVLHDPLAVGAAVDETLVTWEPARLEVGADGQTRRVPGVPNCRVATRVDTERFLTMFLDRLGAGQPGAARR
jgi:inosine-uridine nucleoside N-ribohydrolase